MNSTMANGILIDEDLTSQVDIISPFLQQCLGGGSKGREIPTGSILQIQKICNLSFPSLSDNEVSYDSEKDILKITVTDGHSQGYAIVAGCCPPGLDLNTAPGTKIKITQPVHVEVSLFLLTRSNCEVIGGRVAKLVDTWEAERKHAIKHEWGHNNTETLVVGHELPPPWKPFGHQGSIDVTPLRKMKTADVIGPMKDSQLGGEKSTFDMQREEAISELKQSTCSKFKRPNKHLLGKEVKDIMCKGFSKEEAEGALDRFKDVRRALRFLKNAKSGHNGILKDETKVKIDPSEKKKGKINEDEENELQAPPYKRPTKNISLFGFIEDKIKTLIETTTKTSDTAEVPPEEGQCQDKRSSESIGDLMKKLNTMVLKNGPNSDDKNPDKNQKRRGNWFGGGYSQRCSKDRNATSPRKVKAESQKSSHLQNSRDKAETEKKIFHESTLSFSQKSEASWDQEIFKHQAGKFRDNYYNRVNALGLQRNEAENRDGNQKRSTTNRNNLYFHQRRIPNGNNSEHFRRQQHYMWNGKLGTPSNYPLLYRRPSIGLNQYYRQQFTFDGNVPHAYLQRTSNANNCQQLFPLSENVQSPYKKYLQLQSESYYGRSSNKNVQAVYQQRPLNGDPLTFHQQRFSCEDTQVMCEMPTSSGNAQAVYQQRPLNCDAQGGYRQFLLSGDVQSVFPKRLSSGDAQIRYQVQPPPIRSHQYTYYQEQLLRTDDHLAYQQQFPNPNGHNQFQRLSRHSSVIDQISYQQEFSNASKDEQHHYQQWNIPNKDNEKMHYEQRTCVENENVHQRSPNEKNSTYCQGPSSSNEGVRCYRSLEFNNHRPEQMQGQSLFEFKDYSVPAEHSELKHQTDYYQRSLCGTSTSDPDPDSPIDGEEPVMTIGFWGDTESEREFLLKTNPAASEKDKVWGSFCSGPSGGNYSRRPFSGV